MTTAKKTVFGTFWNVLLNIFNQASSLIVYALLARILNVEQFGLIAFCFLMTEMVILFGNFGVNQILIQKSRWSNRLASSCFWFLLLISIVFAMILALIIAPISNNFFYTGSGMMLASLALAPIINSLSLVSLARMQRNFQYRPIAVVNAVSTTIGGGTSVFMVFQGYGVWAVVFGKLLQTTITTVLFVLYDKFIPMTVIKLKHVKVILNFGLPLFYTTCLNFFSSKSINFITAFLLGSAQFAFVSVAQRASRMLSEVTMTPLNATLLPAFSRVSRNTNLSDVYIRVVKIASVLIVPLYFGVAAIAEEVVFIVFGAQWEVSAELLRVLCFTISANVLGWFLPSMLVARGHTALVFKLNFYAMLSNIILITLGALHSVEGAVYGLFLSTIVTVIIKFRLVKSKVDISLTKVFLASLPALISSVVMVIVSFITFKYADLETTMFSLLILKILLGVFTYCALMFTVFYKHSKHVSTDLFSVLKK